MGGFILQLRILVALFESSILPIGLLVYSPLIDLVFVPIFVALVTSRGIITLFTPMPWKRARVSLICSAPFAIVPIIVFYIVLRVMFQLSEFLYDLPSILDQAAEAISLLLPFDDGRLTSNFSSYFEGQSQRTAEYLIGSMFRLSLLDLIIYVIVTPYLTASLALDTMKEMRAVEKRVLPEIPLGSFQVSTQKIADAADRILTEFSRVVVIGVAGYSAAVSFLFWGAGLQYGTAIGVLLGIFSVSPWISYPVIGLLIIGLSTLQFFGDVVYIICVIAIFIGVTGVYEWAKNKFLAADLKLKTSHGIIASLLALSIMGWVGLLLATPIACFVGLLSKSGAIRSSRPIS